MECEVIVDIWADEDSSYPILIFFDFCLSKMGSHWRVGVKEWQNQTYVLIEHV